jgi:membrane protein implicated in regulation of membrane protease activity
LARRPSRELVIAAIAILDEALIIAAVVLGAIWLSSRLGLPVTPQEAAIAVAPLAVFAALAVIKAVESLSRPPAVGAESMEGKEGVVRAVVAEGGRLKLIVEVEGELWSAECRGCEARVGERVVVVAVRGLTLLVKPAEGRSEVLGEA